MVVPFRGRWEQLGPLIEGLRVQTVRDRLQTVLSIDGLEDPPVFVEEGFDLLVKGPRSGPAAARNRGWRSSDASLILFTDADCVPEPGWAQAMIVGLGGEFDAVKGVYSAGGPSLIQRLAQVEFEERYRIMGKRRSVFLADTYSAGFTRERLEELDGFDESFPLPEHEDVDLSWRLVRLGGRIRFAPDARVSHTHRASWSGYFSLKVRRGRWRVMLLKGFPEMTISDGYTPQNLKLQILFLPALLLAPFLPPWAAWIPWGLFLLLTVPLALTALRTDPGTVPLILPFCIWRAAALLTGTVSGALSGRRF